MDFSQLEANLSPDPKAETLDQSQPNLIKPLNGNTNTPNNTDNDWEHVQTYTQPAIDENNVMTDATDDHKNQFILKSNKSATKHMIESSAEYDTDLLSIQLSSLNEQMKRDEKSLQQCDKQMKLQKMKIANHRMDEDTDTDEYKDLSSTTTSENNGKTHDGDGYGRGVRTLNGSEKWYQNRNTKIFISVVLIAVGLYIVYNKMSSNREMASTATASVLITIGNENGGNDLRPTIDWRSFLKPLERI